jgi:hypothetical protein
LTKPKVGFHERPRSDMTTCYEFVSESVKARTEPRIKELNAQIRNMEYLIRYRDDWTWRTFLQYLRQCLKYLAYLVLSRRSLFFLSIGLLVFLFSTKFGKTSKVASVIGVT